ncbi:protein immune deficiency isoform X2 [Penaeus vannamei]|uniref:protein immune deficiency isoform X2 n=1 Tax=Penaeus vannamei TaxID=6689 RepID=UPI00387F93EE
MVGRGVPRMDNIKTDSAPLGSVSSDFQQGNPSRPQRQIYNITGGSAVHIGPVIHNIHGCNPRSQHKPQDMPLKKDVEELLKCSREIEERDKVEVSEHMGSSWKSLGRVMGFSAGQLENMIADHTRNVDRVYEMMSRWHDREAEDATVARLTQMIIKVKAYHVLKKLTP